MTRHHKHFSTDIKLRSPP
jgi:ALMS motif